jgi:hypothetical protein
MCEALCSVCRWRFAHLCSYAAAKPDETARELTVRGISPEFNRIIDLDDCVVTVVVQALQSLESCNKKAAAFRRALLIRRQAAPDKLIYPFFVFAIMHASVRFGVTLDLAAQPDLLDRVIRANQRMFYILSLYLVEFAVHHSAWPIPLNPRVFIADYDVRIHHTMVVLPMILRELTETGVLSVKTNGEINAVSYVRTMRSREMPMMTSTSTAPPTLASLRTRTKSPDAVAAMQVLAIRCCRVLPACVPVHAGVPALLENMQNWTLSMRALDDDHFDRLYVRYICLACMRADPEFVTDALGVVFCRHCDKSNMIWVNPIHMILRAGETPRVVKRAGITCVVGAHSLRVADASQPVLDGRFICAEHAQEHPWLCLVPPMHAPLVSRLMMARDRRSRDFSASARR